MTEKKDMEKEKIVPDTSILIDQRLSEMVEKGDLKNTKIIIPEAVVDELQAQANRGRETGFEGLDEIKRLRTFQDKGIEVSHIGRRPTEEEIKLANKGRIDALIKDHVDEEDAILYTEDYVQSQVAEAEGLDVVYVEQEEEDKLFIEDYFDEKTMSVHLIEGCEPKVKRGSPGNFRLQKVSEETLDKDELEKLSKNILDLARRKDKAGIEMSKKGVDIVQYDDYRIVIARPPFSLKREITAVRPVVKLTLDDYSVTKKLRNRLEEKAEGILIAGSPGSGKTTFAQSLAEFYSSQGKIVKTLESPRDLNVSKEITQYTELEGRMDNAADALLLVRPDYTVYDEVRKGYDFSTFADLRLAGTGMVGVVHAADPIDAVQRFVGRTELGMIPHVLDTIIHIDSGDITKVYSLSMNVKVPSGMQEQDLARPVIDIRDFETKELEYEIYTYGEENIVVPVQEEKEKGVQRLAKDKIIQELRSFDDNPEVEFVSDDRIVAKVDNDNIAQLIGKNGKTVDKIEDKLGVKIDVEPKTKTTGDKIDFEMGEAGAHVVFNFDNKYSGENANIYIDKEYFFTATVGKNGEIKLTKNSDLGEKIVRALASNKKIEVYVS